MRIILDTNVLLTIFSRRSAYHFVFEALIRGEYQICFTHDILEEYREVLGSRFGEAITEATIQLLVDLPNAIWVKRYFVWNLIIQDPDDNKFVDCAIAANAHYIVTEDRHFSILEKVKFPEVKTLKLAEFIALLQ